MIVIPSVVILALLVWYFIWVHIKTNQLTNSAKAQIATLNSSQMKRVRDAQPQWWSQNMPSDYIERKENEEAKYDIQMESFMRHDLSKGKWTLPNQTTKDDETTLNNVIELHKRDRN